MSKQPPIKEPVGEDDHQKIIIAWKMINVCLCPELAWLHHINNGGTIGDDIRWQVGMENKALGVVKGIPDLFLPVARGMVGGLYIELKTPKAYQSKDSGLLPEQVSFFSHIASNNSLLEIKVCGGYKDAIKAIKDYLDKDCLIAWKTLNVAGNAI